MLILTSRGELIFEEENCLDVSKSYAGSPVEILKCHGMGGNQKWEHDKKSVSLHSTAFLCYSVVELTALFNNMRSLKFKAQLTNAFFATVNQMFCGFSQLATMSSELCSTI